MIDENKIPQRIYVKDYQLATCETDGIADARINAVPYKGGRGKLCEYINIDFLWHDASEEPESDKCILIRFVDYKGNVEYGTDILAPPITWNNWVEICKITKWCYVEDLLPKGGDK